MHWIDPACLPEIGGRFERFLLNPHGDADGLLLADGREVHFPPHMAKDIVPAVEAAPAAELRIRGLKPRAADVFAAVAVQLPDGRWIEDGGPPGKHGPKPPKPHDEAKRADVTVAGAVRRALHGPKGERRGALLEGGEIVRFPPHAAGSIAPLLTPGASFAARGKGIRTRHGIVVEAHEAGPDRERLRPIDGERPPPKKPKKPKPHEGKP